jgi:hypothetical protein
VRLACFPFLYAVVILFFSFSRWASPRLGRIRRMLDFVLFVIIEL